MRALCDPRRYRVDPSRSVVHLFVGRAPHVGHATDFAPTTPVG